MLHQVSIKWPDPLASILSRDRLPVCTFCKQLLPLQSLAQHARDDMLTSPPELHRAVPGCADDLSRRITHRQAGHCVIVRFKGAKGPPMLHGIHLEEAHNVASSK